MPFLALALERETRVTQREPKIISSVRERERERDRKWAGAVRGNVNDLIPYIGKKTILFKWALLHVFLISPMAAPPLSTLGWRLSVVPRLQIGALDKGKGGGAQISDSDYANLIALLPSLTLPTQRGQKRFSLLS